MEQTKEKSALVQVIRERRAVKKGYNDQEVKEAVVRELLEDAIWAPTHKMRQPWRFVFVGADQLPDFAKKVAATYPEERQANREMVLREPSAILVVLMDEADSQKQWEENFGAVASMIQNFWLLAWEKELGAVWKTNSHIYDEAVKQIVGAGPNEKIAGFVHLGYFDTPPAKKERMSLDEKFTSYQD
ncbi:putative NAD(P)H nitroreductase YfhC [Lentibacillus sp. JNUCC-1]|uniref:nitroreductase family protein n=1 Tax=Lentibacillus sp. JNUCC-1 TaxID=2654513 RepID=UPI0012E83911|nr:nitroreductase [Lentibacillus sp. JNUCC-1]MUV38367.1 putative NAD(P)H nitroreductase YfhC [Lentibacillus sp. JNUCC-1]